MVVRVELEMERNGMPQPEVYGFQVETQNLMPGDIIDQFKNVAEEYCKEASFDNTLIPNLEPSFNWDDAFKYIPKKEWQKNGITPVENGTPLDSPTQLQYRLSVKANEPILSPELQHSIQADKITRAVIQKMKEADIAKQQQPTLSPDRAKTMLQDILAKIGKDNKQEQNTPAKNTKDIDTEPER